MTRNGPETTTKLLHGPPDERMELPRLDRRARVIDGEVIGNLGRAQCEPGVPDGYRDHLPPDRFW